MAPYDVLCFAGSELLGLRRPVSAGKAAIERETL
jgi:hypothetical protein